MSLSGSFMQNVAPRGASFQQHPRHVPQAIEFAPRAQIPEPNAVKRSEDFADVVARQLPGMVAAGAVAAPVAKRATRAARPFGKRATSTVVDDDYVGPVDLDQEEFHNTPTKVRRQVQSPGSNTGGILWQNNDLGFVMARYTNGTQLPVVIGSTVYAIKGGEDSCGYDPANPNVCYPLPQLQARIQTSNGANPTSQTLVALKDDLSAYTSDTYIGVGPSQNTGVPYWAEPEAAPAYVWMVDQTTGVLTATHPTGGLLKFAANENRVPYANSQFNGNGDVDAWPTAQTISADHKAIVLYLSKTAAT